MLSRRDLFQTILKRSSLLALAPTVPGFLATTARSAIPEKEGRILVVIQLDGGNDGINTVVPFTDEGYRKHRRLLALPSRRIVKINDRVGLHSALRSFDKLLDAGQLAIVQGVGYPNPSRSHFQSMAIWQTARLKASQRDGFGWLGRGLDAQKQPRKDGDAYFIGTEQLPIALRGRRAIATALERPDDLLLPTGVDWQRALGKTKPTDDLSAYVHRTALNAYTTSANLHALRRASADDASYPLGQLGQQLQLVARLVKANLGARVYHVRQGGYDTHANQLSRHGELLSDLARSVKALLDDLHQAKLADRVVLLAFSEFGRTVRENGSAGTDHGTAGPVFLAGPRIKGGLVGTTPSLTDLDPKHGDLKVGIDFRQVYATVLRDWLRLPTRDALGGTFKPLPLFR